MEFTDHELFSYDALQPCIEAKVLTLELLQGYGHKANGARRTVSKAGA